MASFEWPPSGGGSGVGVSSLNGETGDVILVAGTGITITPSGQNITIASTDLAAAITSINADTTAAQTLTVGTAGTDFAIVDAGSGSHVFNLPTASASNRGALSSADWSTFNGKQAALTIGNLTDAGTDGITVGNGTGAVIGTGTTISQHVADTSHNGYLSSADWSTFNGKGSGTVTGVSVASTNGLAGSSSGGTTPALTLSTTVNSPVLAGNGTAISAATTTGTGSTVVLATAPTMTNPVVGTQSQGDTSTKAASTAYVDTAVANAVAGINPAVAVQAATTSAANTSSLTYNNGASGIGATFTGATNTALVIDGFTFTAVGQRLLVKNDTQSPSGAFNGIYNVTQIQTSILPPILTRALDYDQPSDINNTGAIPVVNGTVNGTTSWLNTAQVVTVGTTPLVFVQFSVNPSNVLTNPMTTGGDIIIGGASGVPTRLANGSAGQVLTSAGGTSAETWTTLPGNYYASVYYPGSTSNYWTNTGGSASDFTVVGTIPTPTVIQNSNFGTISKATSSLPGINFSAPRTGTIKVTVTASFGNDSTTSFAALVLNETVTSTLLGSTTQYTLATGNIQPNTIVGYFPATASTAYNFKLIALTNAGTSFIYSGGATGNVSQLSFSMEYIN